MASLDLPLTVKFSHHTNWGLMKKSEPSTVKVYHKKYEPRERWLRQRINHENIVKLLAIEETEYNNKVIIMELCIDASLWPKNEPENDNDLDDSQFLIVLDVFHRMKYLHNNNLTQQLSRPHQ